MAEIHIYKLIICVIAFYSLKQVNLLNLILFTTTLLGLIIDGNSIGLENKSNSVFCGFVQIWVSLFTIVSMLFQLKFVQSPLVFNCTFVNTTNVDPYLLEPQDNLKYIGIIKSQDIQENLKYYILIFLLLTFQKIISLRQKHSRLRNNSPAPIYSVLFENVTWKDLDKDILHFVKYMINYFFYKFGLEVFFCDLLFFKIQKIDPKFSKSNDTILPQWFGSYK